MLSVIVSLLLIVIIIIFAFMQQPVFGKISAGERLERIRRSPHYKNNLFQNLSPTPGLTEGVSYYSVIKEFFFEKNKRGTRKNILPSRKTDLLQLDPAKNVLVWFGHSSYFMQVAGKNILVDPVFSGSAS